MADLTSLKKLRKSDTHLKEGSMKKFAGIAFALAIISLVLGVVSRVMVHPIPNNGYGLEAEAFLQFANTCLLATIALLLMDKK